MVRDLILICSGCLCMGIFIYIDDLKRKKQEQRQARLNSMGVKNDR